MYHVYGNYNVLPGLKQLKEDKFFEVDADRPLFLYQKMSSITQQTCYREHGMTPQISEAVVRFILDHYPVKLTPPYTFCNLAMQIQEDLAIHRLHEGRDWLAAGHICFPSGWRIEDKIGKPLEEIHAPVPGMNLASSKRLVEIMITKGPYERFVWSPVFEDRWNFHPDRKKLPFDPTSPRLFIKVERQVTYGFAEHQAALFIIRQHLIPEEAIDMPELCKGLISMNAEQRQYKGVTDQLIKYVGDRCLKD